MKKPGLRDRGMVTGSVKNLIEKKIARSVRQLYGHLRVNIFWENIA